MQKGLEIHIEAQSEVLAVEEYATFLGMSAGFGSVVGAFVADESHMAGNTEAVGEIDGDTGSHTYLPCAGCTRVSGVAETETYSAVNEEIEQPVVGAEIGVAGVGVELEEMGGDIEIVDTI